MKRFVSVGETIVEMHGSIADGYKLSLAGHAMEMAIAMRLVLDNGWQVDYVTALGDDPYSQHIVDHLARNDVGFGHVMKIEGRKAGLSFVETTADGPLVTAWRNQSAARLMADDPEALSQAFADAAMIYVAGAAFAILAPRARGRLLKALHRARESGALIVLNPLHWPDLWTSRRVMGSAINVAATIADIVVTARPGETSMLGEASAEAIAARYHGWGVGEIIVRSYRDGTFVSAGGEARWFDIGEVSRGEDTPARYLSARANGQSATAAAAAVSRKPS